MGAAVVFDARGTTLSRPVVVWIFAMSLVAALGAWAGPPAQGSAPTAISVSLDGASRSGPRFDGIGAISGGGNARLLVDYPEPQRSEILDYLFRPNYGASLQMLKMEIGGDSDASTGAEPSIESSRGSVDCRRGYEWWLAEEAVRRNPDLELYGLQWGAPGWVAGRPDAAAGATTTSATTGSAARSAAMPRSLWTQEDIDYVLDWLGCARAHGLDVSYLGGWNERFDPAQDPAGVAWFKRMRAALDANGYGSVELVAADSLDVDKWDVADVMADDPSFNEAVDIIGVHDNCGFPPGPDGDKTPFGYHCSGSAVARSLGKPLWASEDGKLDATRGAPTLLRELLNGYNQAGITGVIEYPLIVAMVDDLPLQNRGLVTAKTPWSGGYQVNKVMWSLAHVTQFVPPGWVHVRRANGALGTTGSFNTFESPNHRRWSLVAQNTGAYRGQRVVGQDLEVRMKGTLAARTVHVWASDLWSSDPRQWFVRRADVHPSHGEFTYRVPAGYAISFTTRRATVRRDDSEGASGVPSGPAALPTAYTAAPDLGGMPKYLSPVDGSFVYEPCALGRPGACIGQQDTEPPVFWMAPTAGSRVPYALVGEDAWTDYTVSSDVLLADPNDEAGLIGRFGGSCPMFSRSCAMANAQDFDGYEFNVTGDGSWVLYRNSISGGRTVLDSGALPAGINGSWHRLRFSAVGSTLSAAVDQETVTTVDDPTYEHGLAGIESSWSRVQYDGLTVS